jgi:hypothetical protein
MYEPSNHIALKNSTNFQMICWLKTTTTCGLALMLTSQRLKVICSARPIFFIMSPWSCLYRGNQRLSPPEEIACRKRDASKPLKVPELSLSVYPHLYNTHSTIPIITAFNFSDRTEETVLVRMIYSYI